MRVIYKYPFDIKDYQNIIMHAGAKILSGQVTVLDGPCLWAEIDSAQRPVNRRIGIVGTGMPIPSSPDWKEAIHIATLQLNAYVWHVYDLGQRNL